MPSTQQPSSRRFLVHAEEAALETLASELPDGVESTPLADADGLVVELPDAGDDPRSTWQSLVERLATADWVSPIVVDGDDQPHLPTGEITVRFDRPPTDEELKGFADAQGLELSRRNEFIAEQASFRPRDRRLTYLPDVVDRLLEEQDVSKAWLNTRSQYRRT